MIDPAEQRAWVEDFLKVAPALPGPYVDVHVQTWEHCFALLSPNVAGPAPSFAVGSGGFTSLETGPRGRREPMECWGLPTEQRAQFSPACPTGPPGIETVVEEAPDPCGSRTMQNVGALPKFLRANQYRPCTASAAARVWPNPIV